MKPLETYSSISDYLKDYGYNPVSDGSGFFNGITIIPVNVIVGHSVKTFDALARKKGWIKDKNGDLSGEELASIYGYPLVMDSWYGMDFNIFEDKFLSKKPTIGKNILTKLAKSILDELIPKSGIEGMVLDIVHSSVCIVKEVK